jgi:hypothetical protein
MAASRHESEGRDEEREERESREAREEDTPETRNYISPEGFKTTVKEDAKRIYDENMSAILAVQEIFAAGNPCSMLAQTCLEVASMSDKESNAEMDRVREQAAREVIEKEGNEE